MAISSTLRAGKFKKKLVSAEELLIEAPLIEESFLPFLDLFNQNLLTPAELTSCYILVILSHRHPKEWPGSPQKNILCSHQMPKLISDLPFKFSERVQARLGANCTLGDIFAKFALKATPQTVNRALLEWSNGKYGLELMFRIPTSREVLAQQKQGRRCVTVLKEARHISKYILGERDSLSFTMHDLIHADHFYHHNDCYLGQLGFYGLLDFVIQEQHFKELELNAEFMQEFDYLISDMNAYAIHLFKCLKSALIHYHSEKELFFNQWITKITSDANEIKSLIELNTSKYIPEKQDQVILYFLEKWRN